MIYLYRVCLEPPKVGESPIMQTVVVCPLAKERDINSVEDGWLA